MKSNSIETLNHHPKVSIGLPVYNGEKFIRKKLESLLMQTFKDFEIIISDNASTDSTSNICKEFIKKDNRIRYIRQENHLRALENYYFVLREAKYEYFVWTAVDDIMLPEFLEKNVNVLLSNRNVACSISKIRLYGKTTEYLGSDQNNSIFTNIIKKIKCDLGYMDTYAVSGSYETKVITYLKHLRHNQIFYGIYRTEQIRKCIIKESFLWVEGAIILNVLKYGDLYVVNEVLLEVYDGGISRSGMIAVSRELNHGLFGVIFPFYHFTLWCAKNLDIKVFLKRFYFFFKINLDGIISIVIDIIRKIKNAGSK